MIALNHRFRSLTLAAIIMVAITTSGCMLTGSPTSMTIIAPEVDMAVDPEWPEVDWGLLVQRPFADQMRNSDRILVRVSRSRLQPWPKSAWLDSMPDMLHSLLIQSLDDSGRFAGVGRAGGMRSPFGLVSEIRRFEIVDEGRGDLSVALALQANLIHQSSGRVVATRSFEHHESVGGASLDEIIIAFEQAMGGLFGQLAGWILTTGQQVSADLDNGRDRPITRGRDG